MSPTDPSPLRKHVVVRCSCAHAFATFTEQIDAWWPQSHRKYDDGALTLEAQPGGRFLERSATGEEALLGTVVACEPPRRLVYTWTPGSLTGPTEVEVRFEEREGQTHVDVIHRVGDAHDIFTERVALFDRAWTSVLDAFSTATNS